MKGRGWIWSLGQRVHTPALAHLHMEVPLLSPHMWYVQTRLGAFSGTSRSSKSLFLSETRKPLLPLLHSLNPICQLSSILRCFVYVR